jgi:hypothetical protein
MAWNFGWAFSPTISGWLQVKYGFGPPFIGTIILYTISVIMYWAFFWRLPVRQTPASGCPLCVHAAGKYHPIEELDVILMGDIIDPLHSTKWLFPPKGQEQYVQIGGRSTSASPKRETPDYIRPWSDPSHPLFAPKLLEVTRAIIEHNQEALEVMRKLANGEFIEFDPANEDGDRDAASRGKIPSRCASITWSATTTGTITSKVKPSTASARNSSTRWVEQSAHPVPLRPAQDHAPSPIGSRTKRRRSSGSSGNTMSSAATATITTPSISTQNSGATMPPSATPSPWKSATATRRNSNANPT